MRYSLSTMSSQPHLTNAVIHSADNGLGVENHSAIAFIACNKNPRRFRSDPSFIYRCENAAAGLKEWGGGASLAHCRSLWPGGNAGTALFHRPSNSPAQRYAHAVLRFRRTLCLADVDDLIFAPELAEFSPAVRNGILSIEQVRAQFASNRAALARFDRISTSTEPLAARLRDAFPGTSVRVVSNAVHHSWRDLDPQPKRQVTRPLITYFPGTRSHDRDFSVYAEGVEAFLARYPDARLVVTGPLEFKLAAKPDQVVHAEKVEFSRYHRLFENTWVNLSPLEDTPFTRCKSALKVIEAGFWNAPTICAPIPDAQRFSCAGALFATDAESCLRQLEAMTGADAYRKVTAGLSARVVALADHKHAASELADFAGLALKEPV